ncbi:hypothetical protein DSM106972_070190 [Dulcicalothrix desertica PCC 7102]|uniref:DUF1643 domain-containing protein n=2 Tax=Dulcicalothrix desertica TaxID=32056 RepID=A0A433V4J1_9CYAN|nr:hypothetical protein DSM106972_070190 [Dulcicalothrix desertica PCC 7102]TWH39213.1 hypothetical protein CAL7102_08427 [Dulcicalothrix desertica PCC 7102]
MYLELDKIWYDVYASIIIMRKSARIVGDYRYLLSRKWDASKPKITFVMLNPSTADAKQDDRTLRKCIHFAKSLGYGSLQVVNLFAYRATKPRELRKVTDPVGPKNNFYIQLATRRTSLIIVAWGTHGGFQGRDKVVQNLISSKQTLYCLGVTKYGYPRHPLYLKKNTKPIIF